MKWPKTESPKFGILFWSHVNDQYIIRILKSWDPENRVPISPKVVVLQNDEMLRSMQGTLTCKFQQKEERASKIGLLLWLEYNYYKIMLQWSEGGK